MATTFFDSFAAELLPHLNSERIWSARISTQPAASSSSSVSSAPSAAAAADAEATAVLLLDASAATEGWVGSGPSCDGDSGGGDDGRGGKAITFSCITRGAAGGPAQLWEARVTADTLEAHRVALGIKTMQVAEFFQLFWAGMFGATVSPEHADGSDSGGSGGGGSSKAHCDDGDDAGGAGGGVGRRRRTLVLEYTIGESIVLRGEFKLTLACAVPAVLFPLLWKLQASGAGTSIVRQSSRASLPSRFSSPAQSQASQSASAGSLYDSPVKRKAGNSQPSQPSQGGSPYTLSQQSAADSASQSSSVGVPAAAAPPRKKGPKRRRLKKGGAKFD